MPYTREIYEKYYSVVTHRYYSDKEKRRLLAFFASAYGITEGSTEFAKISEVVDSVEEYGIESLADCRNFLLIAESIPGKEELIKAVRAAKLSFESHIESSKRTYSNALEWRADVYKNAAIDPEANLEAAYIEYARASLDKAIKRFENLVETRAHIPSVLHLAVIYRKRYKYEDSYFWFSVLECVYKDVLGIEFSEAMENAMGALFAKISEERAAELYEKAKRKVKAKFSWGEGSRSVIGFVPKVS